MATRGGDGRIELELVVTGADEAQEDLNDVADETKKAGDAFKTLQGVMTGLGVAATALGTAFAAAGGAIVAVQNEFARQRDIWTGFRGDLTQVRAAMNGMVSDIEIMSRANELLQRGIQLSGRDLRNVYVAAFQRAEATGVDFNQTLDQLINAIGTGSPRAMRLFGISARDANGAMADLEQRFGDVTAEAESFEDVWDQLGSTVDNTVTTFFQAIEASGELERTWDALAEVIGLSNTSLEDFGNTMQNVALYAAGHFAEALSDIQSQIVNLTTTIRNVRAALGQGDVAGAVRSVQGGIRRTRTIYGDNMENAASRALALQRALGPGADQETVIPPRPGRGGGGRRGNDPFSAENMDESFRRGEAGMDQLNAEAAEEDIRLHREMLEANEEADREYHDAVREMQEEDRERERDFMEERQQKLDDLKEAAIAANRQIAADAEGVLGPVVSGITKSLAEVVAGTKTADEAFQGLLSSFLEMIAQETALQAAKEFAEAIASFARYDYAGGAQHIAAGVAYTAVAVAAGAASIATAPSQPASPEQGGPSSGDTRGTTVNVNYNGPVISAGGRAEVGRTIDQLVEDGRRFYGSTA